MYVPYNIFISFFFRLKSLDCVYLIFFYKTSKNTIAKAWTLFSLTNMELYNYNIFTLYSSDYWWYMFST